MIDCLPEIISDLVLRKDDNEFHFDCRHRNAVIHLITDEGEKTYRCEGNKIFIEDKPDTIPATSWWYNSFVPVEPILPRTEP